MGQTAENVATAYGVSRAEQDEFGVRSQNRAEKAIANGVFEREIVPVTLPDGTVVSTDDGPRPGTTLEAVSALKPVFRPDGTRDGRQLLPAERRRGRGGHHERRRGRPSWVCSRWPGSWPPGSARSARRSWVSVRSRPLAGRCSGPG